MIRYLSLILCLIFVTNFVFADETVVAVVNNEVITKKDLNDFISFTRLQLAQYSLEDTEERISQMLPDLINRLIEDRLILQAAYKADIISSGLLL